MGNYRAIKTYGKVMLLLLAVGGLFYFGRQAGGFVIQFAHWVEGLGFWGPLVFIFGYVLASVAFIPGSLLTLTAGAIFGLSSGTLIVFIAAVLGSSLSFFIARYLLRSVLEKKFKNNPRFSALTKMDEAISEKGLKIVFLLRLSPVFPFNFLNYFLGLTQVTFSDYLFASIGMLPGTLLYVYYGKIIGDVAALAGGASFEKDKVYFAVLIMGLLATFLVTTIITKIARRSLKEATHATS